MYSVIVMNIPHDHTNFVLSQPFIRDRSNFTHIRTGINLRVSVIDGKNDDWVMYLTQGDGNEYLRIIFQEF